MGMAMNFYLVETLRTTPDTPAIARKRAYYETVTKPHQKGGHKQVGPPQKKFKFKAIAPKEKTSEKENIDMINPPILPLEPDLEQDPFDDSRENMDLHQILGELEQNALVPQQTQELEIEQGIVSSQGKTSVQSAMHRKISVKKTSPVLPPTYVFNNCSIENLHLHIHKN